jgi:hypothetical protein
MRLIAGFGWRNWAYLAASLACYAWLDRLDTLGSKEDEGLARLAMMLWLMATGAFVIGNAVNLVLALVLKWRILPALIGMVLPSALIGIMTIAFELTR